MISERFLSNSIWLESWSRQKIQICRCVEWASFGKVIKFLIFCNVSHENTSSGSGLGAPKVKNFKIGVAKKPDLIEYTTGRDWIYSFSSLIRLYQTRIVSSMLVSMIFNLLDRAIKWIFFRQTGNFFRHCLRYVTICPQYTITIYCTQNWTNIYINRTVIFDPRCRP